MPIKDPARRREYERLRKREERARKRRQDLVPEQRRPLAAPAPASFVLEDLAGFRADLADWDQDKLDRTRALYEKAYRALLEAPELSAKEALDILKETSKILDAAAMQQRSAEKEEEHFDVAGLLADPDALAAALLLLPYVSKPAAVAAPAEKDSEGESDGDPGSLCDLRESGELEALPLSPADSGCAAKGRSRKDQAAADQPPAPARKKRVH